MTAKAKLLAIALLTASLAGCLGFGDSDDVESASTDDAFEDTEELNQTANETTEAEEPAIPRPEVSWFNGTAQGGSAGVTNYCAPGCDNAFSFAVENGSTGIVVEMTWENDNALNLYVFPPDEYCESDNPLGLFPDCPDAEYDTDGDDPARVEFLDDRTELDGEWDIFVFAQDSYEEPTAFTIAASVFYGGQAPSDFTKIETAGSGE